MNTNKRTIQNFQESRGGDDAPHTSTLNSRLNVTVIATTQKGTTAALNEAWKLAKDLNAHITLLKMEVVPARFPLEKPPVSLGCTTRQQCSLVLQSSAREHDVTVRSCLCRDRDLSLRRMLRRRALVVIGGRRHWWLSREERLEKILRGMGHHVIFIEVGSKIDWTPQSRFPTALGDPIGQSRKKVGTAESLFGSEGLRRNDPGRLRNHAPDISISSATKGC